MSALDMAGFLWAAHPTSGQLGRCRNRLKTPPRATEDGTFSPLFAACCCCCNRCLSQTKKKYRWFKRAEPTPVANPWGTSALDDITKGYFSEVRDLVRTLSFSGRIETHFARKTQIKWILRSNFICGLYYVIMLCLLLLLLLLWL